MQIHTTIRQEYNNNLQLSKKGSKNITPVQAIGKDQQPLGSLMVKCLKVKSLMPSNVDYMHIPETFI